jgi:hypothetical protein
MRFVPNVLLLSFALFVPLAAGCSAPPDDETATGGGGENEIVRGGGLLGEVGSVRINGVTVTAPEKIDRILDNLDLRVDDEATREEVELGGVPQYLISFHGPGADAPFIASGHFIYIDGVEGSRDRKNAHGSLQLHGKSYALVARDLDALDAIRAEAAGSTRSPAPRP